MLKSKDALVAMRDASDDLKRVCAIVDGDSLLCNMQSNEETYRDIVAATQNIQRRFAEVQAYLFEQLLAGAEAAVAEALDRDE